MTAFRGAWYPMAMPRCLVTAAVAIALGGCTPDVASTGTGGGSASSSSVASGVSTSTGAASTVASSSSSSSSSASSSATGGLVDLQLCEGVFDPFAYASDDEFIVNGEEGGPWQELPSAGAKVFAQGGQVVTEAGMQKFWLALDTVVDLAALPAECAYTVKLTAGATKVAQFGFQKSGGGMFFGVEFDPGDGKLSAFGGAKSTDVTLPVDLAIVHHGGHWYALYDDGAGWTNLGPSNGADPISGFTASMSLGAQATFGTATWDDFDVRPVPAVLFAP